jgi:hypothetical protein
MEANTFPTIESFIIRFVLDETSLAENAQPRYRGEVRHIQSDEEILFQAWEDVVEFVKRYVPLEIKSES